MEPCLSLQSQLWFLHSPYDTPVIPLVSCLMRLAHHGCLVLLPGHLCGTSFVLLIVKG